MDTHNRGYLRGPSAIRRCLPFYALVIFTMLTGCGAPGEPTPARPTLPGAISDLTARQLGASVVLTFTLPRKTVDGETLVEPPTIEIYRGFLPRGATPYKTPSRLVHNIPFPLVSAYLTDGLAKFTDQIDPAELIGHADEQIFYIVRTRVSAKRASADSNVAIVQMYPVAGPISDVRAVVTETAVELSWNPPAHTIFGETPPTIAGYRVYRAEVDTASATSQDLAKLKLKAPLALLASIPTTTYRDTHIEFGRTYQYSIRRVFSTASSEVESADSPILVTPRDIFPPAPPQNLAAVFVPAVADVPAHVELSWGISPETDLAGYRVYRSEREGELGNPLTSELLLAPTFRDMSVTPGHRYTYRVTAVDRAGNESIPGTPVSIDLPKGP